ncbi:PLP-dependent transferase [Mesorhizobium sp.]|uniref:trans-sulfuration enzyme family protein n=1 Tax=Mesorhizobium sp. TaxID=1871066 RepID=UPI0025E7497D|nr:PLP-dependent transferase [Mesorhizobium sp.]
MDNNTKVDTKLADMRLLSPLRHTTDAESSLELAEEQARHFGIDTTTPFGRSLVNLAIRIYETNSASGDLLRATMEGLSQVDRKNRIAWFNAKRFISFQLAKILDTHQNPSRATYQSITTHDGSSISRGAYPLFDNVTALFSANPVITRTATYMFACSEWVEDAFNGREPLHHIYSRLLNPTSIALANHIVDVECGELSNQYMAWNFNSGMAAIDGILSHLLGARDILLVSRNIYGGAYQLIHDWYGKSSNLDVAVMFVDGFEGWDFAKAIAQCKIKYAERIAEGRKVYCYIESPCNPHGYVLDVAAISRACHEEDITVICDSTVGTPLLCPVLKRQDPMERPDFVMHSYTKDLAGFGSTTAGVIIGRNEDMFLPKGTSTTAKAPNGKERTINWNETMFWNVYYIKGAFLDADKAFEVMTGMKTFEMRVVAKAINTITLARALDAHPDINVSCPVLPSSPSHAQFKKGMWQELPAGLFTINMEGKSSRVEIPREAFKRFFDMLEPAIGMQVSLGQTNTVALCPALTTHSELDAKALAESGILLTTTRIAVGLEDPRALLAHMQRAAELAIDEYVPGFSRGFLPPEQIDAIYRETYLEVHRKFIDAQPSYSRLVN